MCYIMVVKKIPGTKVLPDVEQGLKDILFHKMNSNDDGFFLRFGNEIHRSLDGHDIAKGISDIVKLDNILTHFRIATVGEKSLANVHGQQIGNWQFAHNGSVSSFSGGGLREGESDSLKFFKALTSVLKNKTKPEKVGNIIEKVSISKSFFGRGILYNQQHDDLYFFGTAWQLYFIGGAYIVLSSTVIDFDEYKETYKVKGFEFSEDTKPHVKMLHENWEGIGRIKDFMKESWEYELLQKEFKDFRNYSEARKLEWPHVPVPHSPYTSSQEELGAHSRPPQGSIVISSGLKADEEKRMIDYVERELSHNSNSNRFLDIEYETVNPFAVPLLLESERKGNFLKELMDHKKKDLAALRSSFHSTISLNDDSGVTANIEEEFKVENPDDILLTKNGKHHHIHCTCSECIDWHYNMWLTHGKGNDGCVCFSCKTMRTLNREMAMEQRKIEEEIKEESKLVCPCKNCVQGGNVKNCYFNNYAYQMFGKTLE